MAVALIGTTKGFSHFILIQIKSPPWCWLEYYHVVTHDLLNLLSTLGASPTSTPILGTTNPYNTTHLCHSTSVGHRWHDHDQDNLYTRPHKAVSPMHAKNQSSYEKYFQFCITSHKACIVKTVYNYGNHIIIVIYPHISIFRNYFNILKSHRIS